MFNSSLFKKPKVDLAWFWREVKKFNAIANPDGVNPQNQVKLIKEEVKEILESTTEKEFVDGVIDTLVVIAPFREESDYVLAEECLVDYWSLKQFCKNVLESEEVDSSCWYILDELLTLIHRGGYIKECESVLESNMSKFIPVEDYKDTYLEEVRAKYPDADVNLVKRSYKGRDYYVFLNSKTGKVLKGHSYFKEPVINL